MKYFGKINFYKIHKNVFQIRFLTTTKILRKDADGKAVGEEHVDSVVGPADDHARHAEQHKRFRNVPEVTARGWHVMSDR